MSGILLEDVTGAGKTQTLQALMRHPKFSLLLGSGRIFYEEETFGEIMTELQEPGVAVDRRLWRLEHVLSSLKQNPPSFRERSGFVLERFHLSYYVLLPDWNLYALLDEQLAQLQCLTVLLHIPEQDLARRCLDREDRSSTTWTEDMITHFGSPGAALDAVVQSTIRRNEAAKKSRLPLLEIDTGSESWDSYADRIVAAWTSRL